jgi:WD40 repeat protein
MQIMDKSYEITLLDSLSVDTYSNTSDILEHAINASGTRTIATSRQGVFAVFNLETGEYSEPFDNDCGDIWGVALAKEEPFAVTTAAPARYVQSGDAYWFLGLWDIDKGELVSRFKIDPGSYRSASAPNLKITMVNGRGQISWWSPQTQEKLGSVSSPHQTDIFKMAVSGDGAFGATTCTQEVNLWDNKSRKSIKNVLLPKQNFLSKRKMIGSLRFGADHLYMGSNDGKLWVTDISGRMLEMIIDTGYKVWVEAFDVHEEASLAALFIWGHHLEVWDIHSGKLVGAVETGHKDRVYDVRIKPDASSVVITGKDGTVQVWALHEI